MKKSILWMRKILVATLLAVVFTMVVVSVGTASSIPAITQADPTPTFYLDLPTIKGTVGQMFTVNISIRDAPNMSGWQADLSFNANIIECTGFIEGEFLQTVGTTYWTKEIDNTAGVITAYCSIVTGEKANGGGRLAYATFTVFASGVSDLHLRDVEVFEWVGATKNVIPVNIIDVWWRFVVDTTHYTVVPVSNSTGGFCDQAFIPDEELRFNVTGPDPGFSNVTVPETFMSGTLDDWIVKIDGASLSTEERTVTSNGTHYSVYFTYSKGNHKIQISGPYVVPEFPTVILTPLLFILTLIAAFLGKTLWSTKRRRRPTAR